MDCDCSQKKSHGPCELGNFLKYMKSKIRTYNLSAPELDTHSQNPRQRVFDLFGVPLDTTA